MEIIPAAGGRESGLIMAGLVQGGRAKGGGKRIEGGGKGKHEKSDKGSGVYLYLLGRNRQGSARKWGRREEKWEFGSGKKGRRGSGLQG